MINFQFNMPTRILFGRDTHHAVGETTRLYGKKVLLHYGRSSIKESGLYETIVGSLRNARVDFLELSGVQPNPRLSLVRQGIDMCKGNGIDFLLAVGGGSVIDSAKAIAAGSLYDGDVWDFFERKAELERSMPVGVVLTIAAAGSESSCGAVVTKEEGWLKRDIVHECLRPKFAILNPELTVTLPDYQLACGICDMMAHIFERYFTNVEDVDLTDGLCEAALRSIVRNGASVMRNKANYAAQAEIMWAGTLAHNDLLGTGREGDWASHNIEHELSGIYDIAHGAGLSIVFPAWMKHVYRHNPRRFEQFAVNVWDVDYACAKQDQTILEGIARMEGFFRKIGLPTRLGEANIATDRFDEMARKATHNGPLGIFAKLTQEDIVEIFRLAV